MRRLHFKKPPEVRLVDQVDKSAKLKACPSERDQLYKRARNADTAAHIIDWVSSAGLQPPK